FLNVSCAGGPAPRNTKGESSILSVRLPGSSAKAEFGAVSNAVVTVFQRLPLPDVAHPTGRLGAVTPSKLSLRPVALQKSPMEHALPSSHEPECNVCVQPVTESHPSSVQEFPSSQLSGVPLTQPPDPESQVSMPLQTLPSSHWTGVPRQPTGPTKLIVSIHCPTSETLLSDATRHRRTTVLPLAPAG